MTCYDIFNGDADGLCALLQLRLQQPIAATLVTGVKRDIELLDRVPAQTGDQLTVLDISLDSNRPYLQKILESGASVTYFDHHQATPIPQHVKLATYIDTAAEVCTSLLVDRYLQGAQSAWAIVGAFGDNLHQSARQLATTLKLAEAETELLKQLGEALNYNAYGESLADLRYPPQALFHLLYQAADPFSFIRESEHFETLRQGLIEDSRLAENTSPMLHTPNGAIYLLPDTDWARRVSGIFANDLATRNPTRAHAILTHHSDPGHLTVSVRAPRSNPVGADLLCRQFATGGGRKAAAGINKLPEDQLEPFIAAFRQQFGSNK